MIDDKCRILVGTHTLPYWKDKLTGMIVCDRHHNQYTERPDLGPFDWVILEEGE